MEFNTTGSISIDNLVDFVLVERKGSELIKLVSDTFGEVVVVEHFSLFYRLKVVRNQKVGQLFGFFT